ncbi:MAG: hypothetical protein ACI9SY_000010 [Candidatus Paceibacteria bacterium]|jgi:hypothetical protein
MPGNVVSLRTKKPLVRYKINVDPKSAALIAEMKEFYELNDDDELFSESLRVMKELADCYETGHTLVMTKDGQAPIPIRIDELFPPKPTLVTD